jgi:hypothetical protein
VLHSVDRIVARCLRRNPADRYQTAGELARDLEAWAGPSGGVQVAPSVRPPGPEWLERLGRRRVLLAVLGALVIALLAYALWPSTPPAGQTSATPAPQAATPAPTPQAAAPAPAPSTTSYRIDVAEGTAQVYVNGAYRGLTPFDYPASQRETIQLELRQDGFAPLTETFEVTERPVWTFAMHRTSDRQP